MPGRVSPFGDLRLKACLAAQRSLSQPCHVLHRPLVPRHPPRALSSLTHIKARLELPVRLDALAHVQTSRCSLLRSSVIKVRFQDWPGTPASPPAAACGRGRLRSQFSGRATGPARLLSVAAELVIGGAEEIRTPDLRRAKAALSQLSYGPSGVSQYAMAAGGGPRLSNGPGWWAILDSNQRPQSYQDCALTS